MTRDWDLIRNLMKEIEAAPAEKPPNFPGIKHHGASYATVEETLIMIEHAGLIAWRHKSGTYAGTSFGHITLTMDGYDFLDTVDNPTVWEKVKKKFGENLPRVSIALIIEFGKMLVRNYHGMDG